MLGDHGLWIKHCAYEPSWRVPCVIAGPGVKRGVSDALVELSDLNPTLTGLAGLPTQNALDAKSFAPVLRKETKVHRDCVVCTERSLNPEQGSYRAIRTRSEKLILSDNDMTELYDMASDPDERRNLAEHHPDRVKALTRMMIRRHT
jgi:arylsulfatase A-like enzyme